MAGNEARFMNDYRGIASGPNAEFRECWVQMHGESEAAAVAGRESVASEEDNGKERATKSRERARQRWERRMGVFVLGAGKAGKRKEGIKKGEEVLVNYGRTFWRERKGVEGD